MKNILLVENSPRLSETIKAAFKKYESRLNLLVAENGAEAAATLEETPISVLITDPYVPGVDTLDLIASISRRHADTQIIMTAFGSPELTEMLTDLNIHHVQNNPFQTNETLKAVSAAINRINKGEPLNELSLNGFLRLLQDDKRSCTLEVVDGEGSRGCFYFIDGQPRDAECGGLQGEEAAIEMLGWRKVSLELKDLESDDIPARIKTGLQELIAKGGASARTAEPLRQQQVSQATGTDPKKIILQAIGQAKAGHPKPAYNSLAKILKNNPKISLAWLWLARTSENPKTIEVSLKNAATIAPDDPEIKGDIEKFKSAINAGCGEAGSLKHCPFCWAPIIRDKTTCHYCNAHIDIHEDFFHSMFFSSNKEPDLKIVEDSFQRFNKAKSRDPNNPHPYFFLAMAHINLNQWEEALLELEQTGELDPGKNPYQKQLEILIDFTGDLESFFTQEDQGPEKAEIAAETDEPEKAQLIMVVEDSTTTRNIVARMLKKEGYNVIEAKDGAEAVAKFAENRPDLLLLDIMLPGGMDGHQTLAQIRKHPEFKNTPVIMLTARDSLIDKVKGKMSGRAEYLTKPFNSADLIRKIRKAMG